MKTVDPIPFRKTLQPDGNYLVSGSIPGWGEENGVATDQVRRRIQGEVEAERVRADLQAKRESALLARANRHAGMRSLATTLTPAELKSAEAAATLLRESQDARTILQLVKLGLTVETKEAQPLSGLVEPFISHKTAEKIARKSLDSLSSRVRLFVEECGDFPSEQQIKEWISIPESRDGKKNRRADIGNFLGWCHREGHIADNPIPRMPVPKHDADRAPVDLTPGVLTPGQAKELLHAARGLHGGKLIAYTAIGLFAGLRPAEIGRLDPKHVNLELGTILVRGKVRNTNGLRTQRLVPIEPGLEAILRSLDLAKQTLVVDISGHSRLMWATIRSTANLLENWDPDCMRHSYCSYRLARGDSVETVSRDAGNSPITHTKYYLHPRTKKEALEYWALR